MISATSSIFIGIFAILIYVFFLRKPKWVNPPPGPKGIPIFGNIFQLEKAHFRSLVKWGKEYGAIFKIDFAGTPLIVISDHKMLRDMFSDTAFSGRMEASMFDWIADGKLHGIVSNDGEDWEELRRFTMRNLRDFGFGKTAMEQVIMTEVQDLLEGLETDEGKSILNIKDRLILAVVNALWFISTGQRFKLDDPRLLEFTNEAIDGIIKDGVLVLAFPIIGKLFPVLSGYEKVRKAMSDVVQFFKKPIQEHRETITDGYERDYIDIFLNEIKRNGNNPNSAFHGKLGENNLIAVLADLYFGGTDTTSSSLAWLFLYLSKHPDKQRKFQEEIESITGNTRFCTLSDRLQMPYTEATLAEVLRISSLLPQGIAHRVVREKEFYGYTIPKGSLISANLYYIHRDPAIWGDPDTFRPERFLTPDGKTFKKHEAFMPFSTGRRQCLGEGLARDSLFLFATNIFQRFNVEFDHKGPDNGFEPELHFVFTPKPFNIIFRNR